jgi:mRNA interferase MazF
VTSNTAKVYKFEVFLPKETANLSKDSKIKVDQIRVIDKLRLVKEIGAAPTNIIAQLKKLLKSI